MKIVEIIILYVFGEILFKVTQRCPYNVQKKNKENGRNQSPSSVCATTGKGLT